MTGSFLTASCLLTHHISCRVFGWNIKSPRCLSPTTAQIGAPVTSCFSQIKITFKSKRFWTIDEIWEISTGQLMAIGKTLWGSKVPISKGTEVSLSYVQCFLYLVSSSINVSIFHITWLDTFWRGQCLSWTQEEGERNKSLGNTECAWLAIASIFKACGMRNKRGKGWLKENTLAY